MHLRLSVRCEKLDYARSFSIARWTKVATNNVFVSATSAGVRGRGEGAPNARYGESAERAASLLEQLDHEQALVAPASLDELEAQLRALEPRFAHDRAALAALDGALCDWLAKAAGVSLATLLGLPRGPGPRTSFTLGLAAPDELVAKVREAERYPLLKLKLGSGDDRAVLATLRACSDKPLRVDANEGWGDRETALRHLELLVADGGVELVEQPLPAGRLEDVAWLRARTPLPLVADEDCVPGADLSALLEVYDGLNLKLDKQGGILAARHFARTVAERGGRLMVGCMVASSLSLTQAAHVAAQADWADLDGHLLLASDPYEGLELDAAARVWLPPAERCGLGVLRRA